MKIGDLVSFSPNKDFGTLTYIKYCERISKEIGESKTGLIVRVTANSCLVLFGTKHLVLNQSFLKKLNTGD